MIIIRNTFPHDIQHKFGSQFAFAERELTCTQRDTLERYSEIERVCTLLFGVRGFGAMHSGFGVMHGIIVWAQGVKVMLRCMLVGSLYCCFHVSRRLPRL